jgi:septal ring-binding cell division protein DamX
VRDDVTHYLDFRMRAAGYRGPSVFSPAALKLITQSSLGLTRRINILADKALLAAFSSGSHQIGPKEVQAAIRDCEFSDATYGGKATRNRRLVWLAATFAIVLLSSMLWLTAFRPDSAVPTAAANAPAADGAGAITSPSPAQVSAPIAEAAAPPAETAATPASSQPASAASPAGGVPAPSQAPSAAPAATASPTTSPAAAGKTPAAVSTPASLPGHPGIGPLTRDRLEAGRAWLEPLPDDRWFIQIFDTTANRHAEVEALLSRLSPASTEMSNIHVYYSELSGTPRYGVTYGNYATPAAASAAIRGLPRLLRTSKPYPRQARRLR